MDALMRSISQFTLARFKNFAAWQFSCVLLVIAVLCGSATAATPLNKQDSSASSSQCDHLRQVWRDNYQDVWFFDSNGQQVVPTIDEDWVAVRFAAVFATNSDMPEVIRQFNQRYAEALADIVYNPARPDLALYRFKPTHRNGALNAILDGGDTTIRYVLPALVSNGQTKVLGEQINVRWKSQIRAERRQQLLHSIGAVDYAADLSGREEVIKIDPGQMVAWKAANRLAEDVQVVSATPELLVVEAPVTVQFKIASPGGVAGAAIPFSLDIHFTDQVKIEPGTLANLNLKPAEIFRNLFAIDYDTPLSSVDVRHSPIELRGRLYLYASGQFELPSIPVFYRDQSNDASNGGSQIHRIHTPVVSVRMAALVPEGEGDYRLQVPDQMPASLTRVEADTPVSPLSRSALWRALAAIGLLVVGLIVVLSRRSRQQQQQPQLAETTTLQLLQQALVAAEHTQQLQALASVGQALRCYLRDWAAAEDVTLGGGSALFFQQLQPYVEQQWQVQIKHVLQQLDEVLARGDSSAELSGILETVKQLVSALEGQRSAAMPTSDGSVSNR